MGSPPNRLLLWLACVGAWAMMGCTPKIGDDCVLSTDCSSRGDRLCDTAQPSGYCIIAGCQAATCPDEAACVNFNAAEPGCSVNDREVARGSRTYCMRRCDDDSDCRDGYSCRDPKQSPWSADVIENGQVASSPIKVCLIGRAPTMSAVPQAPVCTAGPFDAGTLPLIDASIVPVDASLPDAAGTDAGALDGGLDSSTDAAKDVGAD